MIAALLISRTPADASFLLKAERMRRIWSLPCPILVNINNDSKNPPMIAQGTMILTDRERTKKHRNPPIKQNIAVRVPEANIPFVTSSAVMRKNKRSRLIFVVMAITKKVMAAPAA